jgi:hypothetical protein
MQYRKPYVRVLVITSFAMMAVALRRATGEITHSHSS